MTRNRLVERRLRIEGSILAIVLLLGLLACHPTPNITTPQGQAAYKADQVVLRVNELQAAAISAEAQQQLDTETTKKIVTYCVAANETLKKVPDGWPVTVRQAWASTKATLPPIEAVSVKLAIAALEGILGAL